MQMFGLQVVQCAITFFFSLIVLHASYYGLVLDLQKRHKDYKIKQR